ncbi:TetR/AcrR family transcriptional regulator [Sinimarinibacterium sp. CAU 1509]|uniref:TetR/AcrR family transcriptional regulator n=1 Tax=Sinimarinibacterium sp. CAU 1509 TaxID=2562283 RepID=UPI0010AC3F94|nr:TetR/AcrR family transcriptional regulator [Sinimarinibacterium sp. CAU 1509]TJY55404.1 TetR/AcrR family transcriptional regulator [Sinimarinibacterium sp. CAU 1509]
MKRKTEAAQAPAKRRAGTPGRKPTLKREEIVAAALAILDADGYQALSMHAIARRLNTGPATLYNYFESLSDIEDAIAAELMAAVRAPEVGGPVREQLIDMAVTYYDMVLQHPQVDLLTGPQAVQTRARLVNGAIRAMVDAGVGLESAALTMTVLSGFAYSAAVAARIDGDQRAQHRSLIPAADRDMIEKARASTFFGGPPRDVFRRAVEVTIDRLIPELKPAGRSRGAPR